MPPGPAKSSKRCVLLIVLGILPAAAKSQANFSPFEAPRASAAAPLSSSRTGTDLALPDAPSVSSSVAASEIAAQGVTPPAAPQAQQQPPPNETDGQRRQREREEAARQVKAQEKQRIAGIVPDFNVVLGGVSPPISPAQKWDLVYHSSRDPYTIGLSFIIAGYDEISGDHNGYHWGASGYFKRFGAQYADTVDGAILGNALLPILLHQDPRYFRKGTGSIKSRILYSALSTVICRGDNGHTQANVSNIAGNLLSGAISNLYYPSQDRGVELAITNGLVVTAEGALGGQLLEFSPDLIALAKRHHEAKLARKAAKASPQAAPLINAPVTPPKP